MHRSDFNCIQTRLALQKEENRETKKETNKTFYSLVA